MAQPFPPPPRSSPSSKVRVRFYERFRCVRLAETEMSYFCCNVDFMDRGKCAAAAVQSRLTSTTQTPRHG